MHRIADPLETGRRLLSRWTGKVLTLPVLVLFPHSSCNCRCVMCDIWKANANRRELDRELLEKHVDGIRRLRVRWVVLSGGEALMHSNLWEFCGLLREAGVERISLLSTGLLLAKHADSIVKQCDEVIVSLDGPPGIHDEIRRVPRAFERLDSGVAAVREAAANADCRVRITARSVIQKMNFSEISAIVETAKSLRLDQVSFLPADVSTVAFNRDEPWDADRVGEVALSADEVDDFERILETFLKKHRADIERGYIAESEDKLRKLHQHYAALHGRSEQGAPRCNAPWVSAVIEADGQVRPCFFHPVIGNIRDSGIEEVINGDAAVAFRSALDVSRDPVCRGCVCSLYLDPRQVIS